MSNTGAASFENVDGLGLITMDDGKANALSFDMMRSINSALDAALNADVGAIVLAGREGRFSAGFDLGVMKKGLGHAVDMVNTGGDLMVRLLTFDRPVVAACTGHALAGGAITLMSCDSRIGVAGDFKIGLNETSIGMTVPEWVVTLAEHRLARNHYQQATITARIYSPDQAVGVGFLDEIVNAGDLRDAALSEAARLAALDRQAVLGTREYVRGTTLARIGSLLDEDREQAKKLLAEEA